MGTKDCKFCDKQGLLILPLRYAAVVGESQALADIPALPSTLGTGVKDLTLTHGKYAPRMVREGYIYLLQERAGIKYWEGYMVVEDAFLYKFDVKSPPNAQVDFSCDRSTCGIDASCIAIDKVEFVTKAYLLFTPSPMTEAKLKEYKDNADSFVGKGKMQAFDPKAWAKSGSKGQEHSLKPELIGQHVVEWLLFKQCKEAMSSPLGKTMAQQLFTASSSAYGGTTPPAGDKPAPGRLGVLLHKLKEKEAVAFVLHDHIGVTQELNDYRNAALEPIDAYLVTKDKLQISNQRKLEISQAIEDVKKGVLENLFNADKAALDSYREFSDIQDQRRLDQINILRQTGREEQAKAMEADMARSNKARQQNYDKALENSKKNAPEIWKKKYEPRFTEGEISKFQNELKQFTDHGLSLAQQRVADHKEWITSERLVLAFDTFDRKNVGSGFAFTLEHSVLTMGMVGVKKSAELVDKWINVDKIERDNLYMRAYTFNQDYLQEETNQALGELKSTLGPVDDVSNVSVAAWVGLSKRMVDTFKKLDSAWDEWLRDGRVKAVHTKELEQLKDLSPAQKTEFKNLSKFHRSAEGVVLKYFSEFTQNVSRRSTKGLLDKGIMGAAALMLYPRIGPLAQQLGTAGAPTIRDLLLHVAPDKLADGYKKRSAARNLEMAERRASSTVDANARKVATNISTNLDDSIEELVKDAQKKGKVKIATSMEQLEKELAALDDGKRPSTNNYNQARIGGALMAIEALALANKYRHFDETLKARAEITASIMSLVSIGADMMYAVAKSLREIEPIKGIPNINKAADIVRGGFKITAGTLATAAGGIGALLDLSAGMDESAKANQNNFLIGVYYSRGGIGGISSGLGFIAAFSYCEPLLMRLGATAGRFSVGIMPYMAQGANIAAGLALRRTLWLIRVARFNMIGLGITALEIIYRCFFMDNELQDWCDTCTFRKDKSTTGLFKPTPFADTKKELDALYKAAAQVKS
jgi:hypothetical protein